MVSSLFLLGLVGVYSKHLSPVAQAFDVDCRDLLPRFFAVVRDKGSKLHKHLKQTCVYESSVTSMTMSHYVFAKFQNTNL